MKHSTWLLAALLWGIFLFLGWWAGLDYHERDFMPPFWAFSSAILAVNCAVIIQLSKGA